MEKQSSWSAAGQGMVESFQLWEPLNSIFLLTDCVGKGTVRAKVHNSVKRPFQSFPGVLRVSRREQLLSVRGLGDVVYLCSFPPHQEYLAVLLCGSASSFTPPQPTLALVSAAGKEGAAQLSPGMLVALRGAGKHRQVQLFSSFSLAPKYSLIIVRSKQLAHFYTYPAPCL